MVDLRDMGARVEAELYRRGAKLEGGQLRIDCVNPHHHGDRAKDARYNPTTQTWCCYVCNAAGGLVKGGTLPIAKALGIEGAGEWTEAERAKWAAEAAEMHAEAAVKKAEAMDALRVWWARHQEWRTVDARARVLDYLAAGGIRDHAAEHFGLTGGTWKGRPALVIPWSSGGEVRGIQYRWLSGEGRYETHPGSALRIYNADAVREPVDEVLVVVEGAKKAAAVWSAGWLSVCAVQNKTGWRAAWGQHFGAFDRVVFALDPDAIAQARDAARTVANGYVATLPMKPDDMLAATRGDPTPLMRYIANAERVDL